MPRNTTVNLVSEKGRKLTAEEHDETIGNLKQTADEAFNNAEILQADTDEGLNFLFDNKLDKTEQAADSEKLQGKIPGTDIGDVVVQGDKYVKSGVLSLYTPSDFVGYTVSNSGVWGVESEIIPNGYQSFVTLAGVFYAGTRYAPFTVSVGIAVNSEGALMIQNVLKSNKDVPFKVYKKDTENKVKVLFELSSSFAYLKINVSSININSSGITKTLGWTVSDNTIDYTEIAPVGTKSFMNVGDFGFGGSPQNNDIDNTNITEVLIGASATSPFADGWGTTVFSLRGGSSVYHTEMAFSPVARYPKVRRRNTSGVWIDWVSLIDSESNQTLSGKSFGSHILPSSDNSINLGSASLRFGTVYAGTGTINTSDAREKTSIAQFTENEINASIHLAQEIGTYQFLDSIETKGESARIHIGMTVQRAIEIMEGHGLDPFRYGFICFDEWQDEYIEHPAEYEQIDIPAVFDENGNEIEPARYEQGNIIKEAWQEQTQKAGSRFGFRADQLLLFIARGQEARMKNIEERLALLE